ncbi:Wadjet anti-phage system protein JetA family protein [Clostridium sp. Marseille-QA1073]
MELFQIIPSNFFNIFLSDNRELYIQSMLQIYKETKSNSYDLTVSQCEEILSKYHNDKIFKYKPEIFDKEILDEKVIEGYAKKIIKSLIHYGWLEENIVFEEKAIYISIPSYSIQFVEAIKNIINPATFQTEKCITNIYVNIKAIAKDNIISWIHVQNSYDSIIELERLYQEMTFNLKIYYNRLLQKSNISNLIEEHFDNYTLSPLFNKYFSLKTDDNVYKYRYEIISIINNIINDDELVNVIAKQLSTKKRINDNEAEDEILLCLDKIKTTLEDIDRRQSLVNKKHNEYVAATLYRINYLKNRDEDFKGNIVNILRFISEEKSEGILDIINSYKLIYSFKMYSYKSIYKEKGKRAPFQGEAIREIYDTGNSNEKQKDLIILSNRNKMIYKFRDSVIEDFIRINMDDKERITTGDFLIEDNEDFIKFVMAYKLSQKRRFKYRSQIISDEIKDYGRWRLPNIEFRRI